jgi:hypothetical protein
MHFALCELDDSNKRELSSSPSFSSIGKEKIMMAIGAEMDSVDLSFFYSLFFHLLDIDFGKVNHPPFLFSRN